MRKPSLSSVTLAAARQREPQPAALPTLLDQAAKKLRDLGEAQATTYRKLTTKVQSPARKRRLRRQMARRHPELMAQMAHVEHLKQRAAEG